MGHQIEYFASIPAPAVRKWLGRFAGFDRSECDDLPFAWKGELTTGGVFWANVAPKACNFSLSMNYSGLFSEWPSAVDFVRRFETEFWDEFRKVPLLRVDEFLVGEWHKETGLDWWKFLHPVEELRIWLQRFESHWNWLPPGSSKTNNKFGTRGKS